jgi:hypothetical protein
MIIVVFLIKNIQNMHEKLTTDQEAKRRGIIIKR